MPPCFTCVRDTLMHLLNLKYSNLILKATVILPALADGYCNGEEFGNDMQENIQKLCAELKDDAVALVDAIALPDHILQSTLGHSDGQACLDSRAVEWEFDPPPSGLQAPVRFNASKPGRARTARILRRFHWLHATKPRQNVILFYIEHYAISINVISTYLILWFAQILYSFYDFELELNKSVLFVWNL